MYEVLQHSSTLGIQQIHPITLTILSTIFLAELLIKENNSINKSSFVGSPSIVTYHFLAKSITVHSQAYSAA
jgi:hypothetical protein